MLSLSKKKLQSIHTKIIYAVYGYIRQESEELILSTIIPSSLLQIVLMFYFENIFDECIIKVLKSMYHDVDITISSLEQLNLFCYDMLDILSLQTLELASNSKITIQHLTTAIQTIINTQELQNNAISQGNIYVREFTGKAVVIPEETSKTNVKHIFVKTVKESKTKITQFRMSFDHTVRFLKYNLYQHKGYEFDEQFIIYAGKVLKNDRTLLSYNINDQSTVHLVISPLAPLALAYQTVGKYVSGRIRMNDNHVLIFLTAVIEYLIAEIVELSGRAVQHNKIDKIEPIHIQTAIKNDDELFELCFNNKLNLYYSWMKYHDRDEQMENNLYFQSVCLDISNEETRLDEEKMQIIDDMDDEEEAQKTMISYLFNKQELDVNIIHNLCFQQKEELQRGIQCLDSDHFDPLSNMLQQLIPEGEGEDDEVELDVDSIDDELQVKMYNYMLRAIKQQEIITTEIQTKEIVMETADSYNVGKTKETNVIDNIPYEHTTPTQYENDSNTNKLIEKCFQINMNIKELDVENNYNEILNNNCGLNMDNINDNESNVMYEL
eukprot:82791_1